MAPGDKLAAGFIFGHVGIHGAIGMGHSAIAAVADGGQSKSTGTVLRATSIHPDESAGYGVLQVTADGVVIGCDAGAPRIFGRSPEVLTGCHVDTLLVLPDGGTSNMANGTSSRSEQHHVVARRSDGTAIAVDVVCVEAISDKAAIKLLLVRKANEPVAQRDMASRQSTQRPLHPERVPFSGDMSCGNDTVTDGANVFQRQLRQVLLRSAGEARMTTLLFLDITDMADIADLCGEHVAEMLRSNMEVRINKCLRGGDVAAFVEQGEFIAIIHDVTDGDVMRMVVDRITQAVRQPFLILGREFCLTGDIDTHVHAINGNKSQDLLDHFDRTMQRACAGRAVGIPAAPQLSS